MDKWLIYIALLVLIVVPMTIFLPNLGSPNYLPEYMDMSLIAPLFLFSCLILAYLLFKSA
jgi:hypothetical protein